MNLIELCKKLTSIDSSFSHGTVEIAKFIHEEALGYGLHSELMIENHNGIENANVMISLDSQLREEQLLMISKLDTVEPGEYGLWTKNGANPFNASISGDEMYGLGLADAKADFVTKFVALCRLKNNPPKHHSPVLVGTFGGESGAGAIKLIRKKKIKSKKVLVGAPTNMALANKGPGYARVEISVGLSSEEKKYLETHNLSEGSVSQSRVFHRPSGGIVTAELSHNPISILLEYLKKLPSNTMIITADGGVSDESMPDSAFLEIDLMNSGSDTVLKKLIHIHESLKQLATELKTVRDPMCVPEHSTITIGQIRTQPEEIKISGVCRLIPVSGRDQYESWLENLRLRCLEVGATFRILDYKPPFANFVESTFSKLLLSVAEAQKLPTNFVATKNCTEANVFHRLGAEVFCIGPSEKGDQLSTQLERVRLSELELATQFYQLINERYLQ